MRQDGVGGERYRRSVQPPLQGQGLDREVRVLEREVDERHRERERERQTDQNHLARDRVCNFAGPMAGLLHMACRDSWSLPERT